MVLISIFVVVVALGIAAVIDASHSLDRLLDNIFGSDWGPD